MGKTSDIWKYSQDDADVQIANLMIRQNCSFLFIESPELKKLFKLAYPKLERLCALTSISNTLTRIAQMLHCIPSTSVSSERLFSKAGIIYSNDLRNRLPGKMVQKILIIKGNLNKVELAPLIDNEEEDVEEIDSDDE
uniref:HAT C-terminal dimerisation domain-containing protein n=1 Tax=Meloidogyne javanica TaxID=6303 RepID=A0A915LE77_MELJA